jgi:hypothetical protein
MWKIHIKSCIFVKTKKNKIMKKVLCVLGLFIILLSSCSKEQLNGPCNCGLVLSDDVSNYSVVIRNNCSGNERRFYLLPGDWMNAFVGQNYCITNVSGW